MRVNEWLGEIEFLGHRIQSCVPEAVVVEEISGHSDDARTFEPGHRVPYVFH